MLNTQGEPRDGRAKVLIRTTLLAGLSINGKIFEGFL